jgi:inward rectifier potassium channel
VYLPTSALSPRSTPRPHDPVEGAAWPTIDDGKQFTRHQAAQLTREDTQILQASAARQEHFLRFSCVGRSRRVRVDDEDVPHARAPSIRRWRRPSACCSRGYMNRDDRIRFAERPSWRPRTVVYGRATHPLADLFHFVLTRSWSLLLVILCAGFIAINAGFALLYTLDPGAIAASDGSFEDAFFFSVQTMATIGYGAMHPQTRFAHVLVTLEAMIGVLSTAIVTGLTFARFARPSARVLFAERAVIGPHNGEPHLMFRLANWRHDDVVDAQVQVILLVSERTTEGEIQRRMIEIPLVADRTPLFSATWTVMHRIDAASPFHGTGALAALRAGASELFLGVRGIDETFNTEVHARHRYTINDIAVGARFANVLMIRPDGTREIDYRYFHRLEPIDASATATPHEREAPRR